jgi:2-polyprenyl-3-methyl-5-hydroxy-6-metoxy-1,4-benzoquinol methylase
MPYSDPTNKPWTAKKIKEINPSTVLDVGAGAGVYLDLIRENVGNNTIVTAVEVWQPNVEQFSLKKRYDRVINEDVRKIDNFDYDLVIFGDVLEHMSETDAVELWDKVSKQAKAAIISIPIVHYHQDAYEGNPYEVHIEEDWNTDRVKKAFHSIVESKEFEVTGVFIAKFGE